MTERRTQTRTTTRRRGAGSAGAERRYALVKWGLLVALVVYALLVVGMNAARNVDFSVIRSAMAAAPGVAGLKTMDENGFQERLDIAPDGCEGWLMVGSEDIMDVSELMIAKGDAAALDGLESAVQRRLEAQLTVFRSYGVNQKDLLEGARVLRRGDYLFYAVGEQADRWEDAFLACIR